MSTTPAETYDVRGRSVQIDYDEDSHTVTVHSLNIREQLDGITNPQAQLEKLGIYTRVQQVATITRNHITVTLKPAASVELRGPTENSDKAHTLMARPVSKQFDGSTITKRRGKYGYTATCSMDLMEEVGLDDYDYDPIDSDSERPTAAMYAELIDGRLSLRVIPEDAPHAMTARIDSTGLIGVPNGLAAAADLDGHGIKWELADDGDSLVGQTTFEPEPFEMPPNVDDPNAHSRDQHHRAAVSYVEQELEDRVQTHFTVYVKRKLIEYDSEPVLGWGTDPSLFEREEKPTPEEVLRDYVDVQLVNIDGALGLYVTNNIRPQYVDEVDISEASQTSDDLWKAKVRTAPCVRKLYRNDTNGQVTFSFPHSLAYAMKFTDEWRRIRDISDDDEPEYRLIKDVARGKQVDWAYENGGMLGVPRHPSEVEGVVAEEDVNGWLAERGLDRTNGIL